MTELVKLPTGTNRKPADELGEIRDRIKALEVREAELRRMMLSGECSLTGDDYKITIKKSKIEKLDMARFKKEIGMQALRPFMDTVERVTVWANRKKKSDADD